jgi:hypothetical protein
VETIKYFKHKPTNITTCYKAYRTMQPSSTSQPSSHSLLHPSAVSSTGMQPTGQPSTQPTSQPHCSHYPFRHLNLLHIHPSTKCQGSQPKYQPSSQLTIQPSSDPTSQPASQPSFQLTGRPICQPSAKPCNLAYKHWISRERNHRHNLHRNLSAQIIAKLATNILTFLGVVKSAAMTALPQSTLQPGSQYTYDSSS